jgi:hypothetical protein
MGIRTSVKEKPMGVNMVCGHIIKEYLNAIE